jgi:DNA-binding IclR family transcriptional regulator
MMNSATRTLEIFEAFASAKRPLTLTELSQMLRAPVSTCFGLIRALEGQGYLDAVSTRKELYPTRRMLQNAQIIAAHEPVLQRLSRQLQQLRDQTQETVIIGQMHVAGTKVTYLDIIESPQTIRYTAGIGDIKPLHSSAIGKAILAALPPQRLEALLKKLPLASVTERTLTSKAKLLADLEQGRERGYQMTNGENVADVGAIAKSITISDRTFGIAVAAPLYRMKNKIGDYATALGTVCKEIEAAS